MKVTSKITWVDAEDKQENIFKQGNLVEGIYGKPIIRCSNENGTIPSNFAGMVEVTAGGFMAGVYSKTWNKSGFKAFYGTQTTITERD